MFQHRCGDAGIQRDGCFTKADAAIDVDFLCDHVEAREGAGQAATLHEDVTLFRLDDVVGGERVRAKLRICPGDTRRGGRSEDVPCGQQGRRGVDEGPAIDGDPVRIGDDDMGARTGNCQRPFEACPKGAPRARHLVDDGAGVCRAVVELDAVARHIEMRVLVVTRSGGAGWRLDIHDDGGAGTARLADIGGVRMFDHASDIGRLAGCCQSACQKQAKCEDACDVDHTVTLTALRSNTGV